MSVHYKFKSAITYDTIAFDGLHISVRDLKKAILHQKQIGKSTDFDLQITNAQSNEVYTDEAALIPKNSSLIVVRVPLTAQQKKAWEKSDATNLHLIGLHKGTADSPDQILNKFAKSADLTSIDASEEDKIKVAILQSTHDYDPSKYVRIKGSNQVGEIPSTYRCYKCMQPGHWIKDCKLNAQPDTSVEIKKSTGIPRSFMVPVDGPEVPGAMMTPTGHFAVPTIDHQARQQVGKKPQEPITIDKPAIPEDLICGVCKDLLTDAVMIPCCGNSFCDECIRNVLLESEDHQCLDCKEKDVSPDTLIPNRFLRNSVNNFKNQTGYSRVVPLKPPPAPPKKPDEFKEPEALPASGEPHKENEGAMVPGSKVPVTHVEPPAIETKNDPRVSEPIEVDDDSPNGNGPRGHSGMPYPSPIPSIYSSYTVFPPHLPPLMNPRDNPVPNPHINHPHGNPPHPPHQRPPHPHSNPHPFPPQGPPPPGQVDDHRHPDRRHPHPRDHHFKPRGRDDHRMNDDMPPRPRFNPPEPRPLMAQPPPHIHFSQSGGYQVYQPYRPDFRLRGPRPTNHPPPPLPYVRPVPAQPLPPAVSPTRPSVHGDMDEYNRMYNNFMNTVGRKPRRRSRSYSRSSSRTPSPRGRSRTPPARRSRSRNRSRTPKARSPLLKGRSPPPKGRSPIKRPRGRSRSPPHPRGRGSFSRSRTRTPPSYNKRRSRSRSRSYHSGSRSRSRSLGRGSPRRRKRLPKSPAKLSPVASLNYSSPPRHYGSKYGKDYPREPERPRDNSRATYKTTSRRQDYQTSSRNNQDYISAQEYARGGDRYDESRYGQTYSKYSKDNDKYVPPSLMSFDWETVRDREQEQQEREKISSYYGGMSSSNEISSYQAVNENMRYPPKRRVHVEEQHPIQSILSLTETRKDHRRDRERDRRSDKKEIVELFAEQDFETRLSPEKEKTPERKSKEKKKKRKDDSDKRKKKRRTKDRSSSKIIDENTLLHERKELKDELKESDELHKPSREKIKGLPLTIKPITKPSSSPVLDDLYQGLDASVDMHALENMGKDETKETSPVQSRPIPVISAGIERVKDIEDKSREVLKEIALEKEVPKSTTAEADSSTPKDVVLAPVPELSKWEKDDDILILSEAKEGYDRLVNPVSTDTKQVTSEVLKRAENAIFKKVFNPVKNQINDKKTEKDRTEKTDKTEKPEKIEKVEKLEKVEKSERPEKIEKGEKIERAERKKEKGESRHRESKDDDRKKSRDDKHISEIITIDSGYSKESRTKSSSSVSEEGRSKKSDLTGIVKEKPRISAKERLGAKIDDSSSYKRDKEDKISKTRYDKDIPARVIHRAEHRSHKDSRKVLSLKNRDEHKKHDTPLSNEKMEAAMNLLMSGFQPEDLLKEDKSCKRRSLDLSAEEFVEIKKQKIAKDDSSDSTASSDSGRKHKKKKKRSSRKKKRRRKREVSSEDSESSSSSSRDSDSEDEEIVHKKKKKKKKDDKKKSSHKKSKKRKKSKK